MTDLLLTTLRWLSWDAAFIVATWVLYLAVMNLAANRRELTPVPKAIAYGIVLPIGYLCDAVLNLHFCVIVWRPPRDWLLTGTLKRTLNNEQGWRESTAAWICGHLLDPFDPKGTHC